jgi:AraC-like DNA-binding protein
MLISQTVDVATLPAADRFGYWSELIAQQAAAQLISSEHAADFGAWSQVVDLGSIRLTSFRYPSLDTVRTPRLIRQSDPELYQLALPTTGRSSIEQERSRSALRSTDFTLLDSSRPHKASHSPSNSSRPQGPQLATSITVLIPHRALPLPANKVGELCAARLPAGEGMGALTAQYLLRLANHPEQYEQAQAPVLGRTALNLIAAMIAKQLSITSMLPTEVRDSALRVSINTFIGTHLGDKDLNPDTVAAAHYISPRTLRRLFGAEQTSVSAEIRNRRLERCRHELENPKLHDTPVRAIGARWGFRERAHFNKVFKQQYGMAPLEYRERHRLQDSHPAGGAS